MTKLPKRTQSQKIGASAADILSSVLTEFCNVIPVPQDRDLGIDFICEIMQGEYPTGKLFNIQCKGKEYAQIKANKITIPIAVKTINYWLIQPNPTFLFIVDCHKSIFYWSFPKVFLDSLNKSWKNQKTVSVPCEPQDSFNLNISHLPEKLVSIVDFKASRSPKNGDYLGTLTLTDALHRAITSGLQILRSPFYRPFQYIGLPIAEATKLVGSKPNNAGNIIIDSQEAYMLLEGEGNFISYVDVEIRETAPWSQSRPFDSNAILGTLGINPSELELVRKQMHFHTYYDHTRKLKVSVSCQYEGAPLSVGFSGKYYKM